MILIDHEISMNENLPEEYLEPIKTLWADAGVQKAVLKGNEYALHDNLS
jgi:guanine nucleotide-binding protein subunit alpha, other